MSDDGWQHDGGTVFTKIEVGAKRLPNPTSAAAHMLRRTTRRADNQELIEILEMPLGRRDRRMERALRRPTDIVTEVVMAVVGEDDEEETAMHPKDASLYRASCKDQLPCPRSLRAPVRQQGVQPTHVLPEGVRLGADQANRQVLSGPTALGSSPFMASCARRDNTICRIKSGGLQGNAKEHERCLLYARQSPAR